MVRIAAENCGSDQNINHAFGILQATRTRISKQNTSLVLHVVVPYSTYKKRQPRLEPRPTTSKGSKLVLWAVLLTDQERWQMPTTAM